MSALIRDAYERLNRDIGELTNLMSRLEPAAARVSPIPPTPRGAESDPVETIQVDPLEGHDAVKAANACYRDLHIHPSHSQKVARRSVGFLWYSPERTPEALEIPELVGRINASKNEIERIITEDYTTRKERFDTLRLNCPAVMTVHLYRTIKCFPDPIKPIKGNVESVRFTWQRKDLRATAKKEKLLGDIAKELEYSGRDYAVPLSQLMDAISATPAALLRTRRAARVQPVANLFIKGQVHTVNAPMPLLIIQDADLAFNAIGHYDASERRKVRSDRSTVTVLGSFAGLVVEALPPPP